MTGRRPGIVLIMEGPRREQRYLARLGKAMQELEVRVWT